MPKKWPYPKPKNKAVTRSMKANKPKDTGPELLLRKELYHGGMRGYRANYAKAPGKPDICFVSRKLAIFVHGCFWHRCPICTDKLPKHNRTFWKNKFTANIQRDRDKEEALRKAGWRVLIYWECTVKKDRMPIVEEIREEYRNIKEGWKI